MNTLDIDRTTAVAKRKPTETNNRRVDLRAPDDWFQVAEEAARQKGLSVSAYIRMAVSDRMKQDGFDYPPKKPKRP